MGGVGPAHCQSIPRGLGWEDNWVQCQICGRWKKSSPGGGEGALAGAARHPHGSKADRRVWTGSLLAEGESVHLTGQPGVALQSGS